MGICYGRFIDVIVCRSMTPMKSGHPANRFTVACLEPVGRGQRDGILGQHAWQAGEHVGEVFLGIDAQTAAVFHDGVKDGALLAGFFIAYEQPVFRTKLGRSDRVFHAVILKRKMETWSNIHK